MTIHWPPQGTPPVTGPGSVTWHYKGAWRTSPTYGIGDVVTEGSITYLASANNLTNVRPSQDARWVPIGASAPGPKGDPGPTGPVGPKGATGAVAIAQPIVWTDITMENTWTADPDNPPQWGVDGASTIWLRGQANQGNGANGIIGHLPQAAFPRRGHRWASYFQRGQVLGASYAPPQFGAIIADDATKALDLDTSYKSGAGDVVSDPSTTHGLTALVSHDLVRVRDIYTVTGTINKPVGQAFQIPTGGLDGDPATVVLFSTPTTWMVGEYPRLVPLTTEATYSIDNGPWLALTLNWQIITPSPTDLKYQYAIWSAPELGKAVAGGPSGFNAYDIRIRVTNLVYESWTDRAVNG